MPWPTAENEERIEQMLSIERVLAPNYILECSLLTVITLCWLSGVATPFFVSPDQLRIDFKYLDQIVKGYFLWKCLRHLWTDCSTKLPMMFCCLMFSQLFLFWLIREFQAGGGGPSGEPLTVCCVTWQHWVRGGQYKL